MSANSSKEKTKKQKNYSGYSNTIMSPKYLVKFWHTNELNATQIFEIFKYVIDPENASKVFPYKWQGRDIRKQLIYPYSVKPSIEQSLNQDSLFNLYSMYVDLF